MLNLSVQNLNATEIFHYPLLPQNTGSRGYFFEKVGI